MLGLVPSIAVLRHLLNPLLLPFLRHHPLHGLTEGVAFDHFGSEYFGGNLASVDMYRCIDMWIIVYLVWWNNN